MMKKLLTIVFCTFYLCISAWAQQLIPLSVSLDDDELPIVHGHPKSPINPPTVYIEDYTLTFAVNHPEYVLYIKDENDVVVYTTVVTSAETQVTLPSTLAGDYKIELVMDNWLFTGWISLS